MSKAIKSDGVVNAQVRRLCATMQGRDQVAIDALLRDDLLLRQCQWGTLCLAADTYEQVYDEKNWDIMRHILIKARQSSAWRLLQATKPATDYGDETDSDDPLEILKNHKACPDLDAPTRSVEA